MINMFVRVYLSRSHYHGLKARATLKKVCVSSVNVMTRHPRGTPLQLTNGLRQLAHRGLAPFG